jgi:hypothetical protein
VVTGVGDRPDPRRGTQVIDAVSYFNITRYRLVPVTEITAIDNSVDPGIYHILHDQAMSYMAVHDTLIPAGGPREAHVAGRVTQMLATAHSYLVTVGRHMTSYPLDLPGCSAVYVTMRPKSVVTP